MQNDFSKITKAMRYWLLGRGYFQASKALKLASDFHTSTRRDGFTPEFEHQIAQAHYARTLEPFLDDPETVIAVAFLHDTMEDYGLTHQELDKLFTRKITLGTDNMSKIIAGVEKPEDVYFDEIANCPTASINKLLDRIHNLETMPNAFDRAKQEKYIAKTEERFYKLADIAAQNFPSQKPVYDALTKTISDTINLTRSLHRAEDSVSLGVDGEALSLPTIWQGKSQKIDDLIAPLNDMSGDLSQRQELLWRNQAKMVLSSLKEIRVNHPEVEQICEFYKSQIITRYNLLEMIEQARWDHNPYFSNDHRAMAKHATPKPFKFPTP